MWACCTLRTAVRMHQNKTVELLPRGGKPIVATFVKRTGPPVLRTRQQA